MDIWRRIFEFDYQLEMYKPAAKQQWVLRIADLVRRPAGGKLDAAAHRKAGLLRVDAIHQDARFGKTVSAAVREEIRGLARWAGTGRQTACISGSPHRVP